MAITGKDMDVAEILKNGGIGVLPTDTIYGITASALDEKAVLKVYELRKRNPEKPFIILVSSYEDLDLFGVKSSEPVKKVLNKIWPGKVSAILECKSEKFEYLHRGTKTLAFRFPDKKDLIGLLKETGPLIAPSANFEGEPPALTIKEAENYFGPVRNSPPQRSFDPRHGGAGAVSNGIGIDFYEDAGKLESLPSTLITIGEDGSVTVLREGAVKIVL